MKENKGFGAFFKTNFDAISKLFLNHVAMCVFGIVVSIATMMLNVEAFGGSKGNFGVLGYIMCGVGIILYLGLIYVCMWEKGASDKIKIDGGRLKKNNYKGLLFWLVANAIDIFIVLNAIILSLIEKGAGENGVLGTFYGITGMASMLYNGMYYPILYHLFGRFTWLFFIVFIPGAIVAWLSYISGIKGHRCIFPEPKKEQSRKTR